MNERILELVIKAQELAGEQHHTGRALDLKGMEQVPDFQIFMDRVHTSYEKFAELIVLECCQFEKTYGGDAGLVARSFSRKIREHFGVEE